MGADGAVMSRKLPAMAMFADASGGILRRKIEFHRARRSFTGFGFTSGETLKPDSVADDRSGSVEEPLHCALDPELRFETAFRRIGAGLANLGNTCFLNSVLQCLTYTEPLAAYLQGGKHKLTCRNAGFCALCALQNHVTEALESTGKTIRPSHLVKNLRCISRNFRNSRQEDAHEYMINFLEAMHKCSLPSGVSTESASAYEKSLVHKIFGGRLKSLVKCTKCLYSSEKVDPFLDLSLEILKSDKLGKALLNFTAEEQLDGGEKEYRCPQCDKKVNALKKLTIQKAPFVLIIHLKRFGSHGSGQKIGKHVDFDPDLNLKPYISDPLDEDLVYKLYGVLVHSGSGMHSGHYYCFVRTSSGMWYSLNDDQVSQVSEKTVLLQRAYMLFYVRQIKSPPLKGNNRTHSEKKISKLLARDDSVILKQPECEVIACRYIFIILNAYFIIIFKIELKKVQEPNGLSDAKSHEIDKCKITCKRRGQKICQFKNIWFGRRRFLQLSLNMQKNKRVEKERQTLTNDDAGKATTSDINAKSERVERGLTSSSSSHESLTPFRDIGELSVPRWDDAEMQPEIQVVDDDEPVSIGYLLDEEEKEYDRGRRKKVRTRSDSFGGLNPFEELALSRIQKKARDGRPLR